MGRDICPFAHIWYSLPTANDIQFSCRFPSISHTGVLGIKVKVMLPHDPTGKTGPKKPLPDNVQVVEPKKEELVGEPYSEQKLGKPALDQGH